MFSPIVPTASLIVSATDLSECGYFAADVLAWSPPWASATLATLRTISWNASLRATKSVSELTSTTTASRRPASTPIRPSAAVRPAFLSALEMPFLRSQSTAASMSPLVSVERRLAVHHARAGQFAEFFDLCSRNAHRQPLCLEMRRRTIDIDDAPRRRRYSAPIFRKCEGRVTGLRDQACGASASGVVFGRGGGFASAGSTGASADAPTSTPSEPCWRAMPSMRRLGDQVAIERDGARARRHCPGSGNRSCPDRSWNR